MIERWWGIFPRKACRDGPPFYEDARTFHHFLASFLWAFLLMKVYSNGVFVIREDGIGREDIDLGDSALVCIFGILCQIFEIFFCSKKL